MAHFNKVGLVLLNEDETKFLHCQKDRNNVTQQYILPGGQIEEGESDVECLQREIKEELDCGLDLESLEYIGHYEDVAAGHPDKTVSIKLYQGRVLGTPEPSSEIKYFHWVGKEG